MIVLDRIMLLRSQYSVLPPAHVLLDGGAIPEGFSKQFTGALLRAIYLWRAGLRANETPGKDKGLLTDLLPHEPWRLLW